MYCYSTGKNNDIMFFFIEITRFALNKMSRERTDYKDRLRLQTLQMKQSPQHKLISNNLYLVTQVAKLWAKSLPCSVANPCFFTCFHDSSIQTDSA